MTFTTLYQIQNLIEKECIRIEDIKKRAKISLSQYEEANGIPYSCREKPEKVPEKYRREYAALVDDYNFVNQKFTEIQSAKHEFMQQDWR